MDSLINAKHQMKVAAHDGLGRVTGGLKVIRCFPFERKYIADFARATRKAHARRPDWPKFTLFDLRRRAAERYA